MSLPEPAPADNPAALLAAVADAEKELLAIDPAAVWTQWNGSRVPGRVRGLLAALDALAARVDSATPPPEPVPLSRLLALGLTTTEGVTLALGHVRGLRAWARGLAGPGGRRKPDRATVKLGRAAARLRARGFTWKEISATLGEPVERARNAARRYAPGEGGGQTPV